VTLLGTDLVVLLAVVVVGFAVGYVLLMARLKAMITERQLKIADQLGALDDAIRALETRLTEHQVQVPESAQPKPAADVHAATMNSAESDDSEESGEIAPEVQAAIAAATVAALGPDAVVQSVKPALSPWSQQGRVMVQGGHNLRVPR
jgi:hypothetical protein